MTMTQYFARLVDDVVVEVISLADELTLANCYTPNLVSTMVPADVSVREGYIYNPEAQTFAAPVTPTPTPTQLLAGKVSAGIQIVSTGTSSLNGTYAIDDGARANLTGILTDIANGLGLPLGQSTVPWADINGQPHSFTATQIQALGGAIRDYSYSLQVTWNLLNNGQSASWPTLPVTIA